MANTTTKNAFYHGDCLFVLTHDIPAESIDLIYLDPPFFTGKIQKGTKKWQPGAMEISFEDTKGYWSNHLEAMRQKAPVWLSDIGNRRVALAAYLYYMMERLQTCYRVLKKTGSIYLHCDWRAAHYLKVVMDEIFGYDNFRSEIAWRKLTAAKAQSKLFSNVKDTIFLYSKSNTPTFKPQFTKGQKDEHNYPYAEENTGRRYGSFDFTQKGSGPPRKFGDKLLHPPSGKHWIWSQEKIDEAIREERIIFTSSGLPRIKRYLDEKKGNYLGDLWVDDEVAPLSANSAERRGYPTQKPESLLERIIRTSSNEGDWVLDPFCGCGTAIVVAHKLNRRWIGVDINRTAYEITKGREVQMPLGMREEFAKANYISRDLEEVGSMGAREFEKWVNEFYSAAKPLPDKGVDGVTKDGIAIQTKTGGVDYGIVSQFLSDAQLHSKVSQPAKRMIIVSQTGFDDSARKRAFEIKAKFGIEIQLKEPKDLLLVRED